MIHVLNQHVGQIEDARLLLQLARLLGELLLRPLPLKNVLLKDGTCRLEARRA